MRIACVGGGPAGLYFAILASRLDAAHEVTVFDRFPEGVTYGWGVVFWDGLLDDLDVNDGPSARAVRANAFRWQDQTVHVQGRQPVRIPSHGFSVGRQTLLSILGARAREVGVDVRYGHAIDDLAELDGHDLVVACDGVNSRLRERHRREFGTVVDRRRNKYIWLGTTKRFDSFTFPFVHTAAGWVWCHAYGFDAGASTFIVETSPETWAGLGFDTLGPDATMRRLEELFGEHLDGHALRPQAGTRDRTPWCEFQTVTNERWHHGNVALMGDAAHTTHFTIGSGTRLALEDAIGLAAQLRAHTALEPALAAYGRRRAAELRPIQREARNSAQWFERVPRYIDQDDAWFADLLVGRRSWFLPRLPPRAYLRLRHAATRAPALSRPARRAVQRWGA